MLVRRRLELLGEDLDRDGLQQTAERVAKALTWLTRDAQRREAELQDHYQRAAAAVP